MHPLTCALFSDPLRKPDAFYTREKEIEEIKSLIPEIKEKIADTKDMQNETIKKLGDKSNLNQQTTLCDASKGKS